MSSARGGTPCSTYTLEVRRNRNRSARDEGKEWNDESEGRLILEARRFERCRLIQNKLIEQLS